MSVDDIINSVGSRRARSPDVSASQPLKKWWVAERTTPILLEYQEQLLIKVATEICNLREYIEQTSILLTEEEGHSTPGEDVKIELLVVETELERVKFIARAYKRARLEKIDKLAQFYLGEQNNPGGPGPYMAKDEWIYCYHRLNLLRDHYGESFMDSLPEKLGNLDDVGVLEEPMADEPDLEQPVVVRITRDIPGGGYIEMGQDTLQLERGHIYMLRYSKIAELLEYLELI